MVPPCPSAGSRRQGRVCACFDADLAAKIARAPDSWLIIINVLGLSGELRIFPIHRCTMRSLSAFLACAFRSRRVGRFRRQPRLHYCQPGRRLRRRPVPCQGRQMRRACRPLLLPVTGFCTGHFLPPRRSRRDHRRGSARRPTRTAPAAAAANTSPSPASAETALSRRIEPDVLPHRRPGNDVTLPRETGIASGLGRALWALSPRGIVLNGRICLTT